MNIQQLSVCLFYFVKCSADGAARSLYFESEQIEWAANQTETKERVKC